MRIYVPNSAFLGNIEAFVQRLEPTSGDLEVTLNERWVAVHPMVLAMVAAAGAKARRDGATVQIAETPARSLPYLIRMGLYGALGAPAPTDVVAHEAAGRFIPLSQIRTNEDLAEFIIEMIPLLHAPEASDSIKYVVSELVRNVLEHSRSRDGAFVCAQYFATSRRLSVGVADTGRGIRSSLSEHHPVGSDLEAIHLAMQPGITGTSPNFGGNEYNAGAGLFFTKSIARASRNFFVVYSGGALFKLLKGAETADRVLHADSTRDYATRHSDLPEWQGTAIGIDIAIDASATFQQLLDDIYTAYRLEIRSAKKDRFKRARFA
jgi:anti-sigma regulatory factor (Ser/Thr protein kinase)